MRLGLDTQCFRYVRSLVVTNLEYIIYAVQIDIASGLEDTPVRGYSSRANADSSP